MQQASIRLLGLSAEQIRKQAEEIIFGILRQVIAGMGIEEINRDRDKFLQAIQMHLESELNKIGLQLINVNITDITDESGYIDAIGQKAASEAIQKARGDVAENVRMGETRVAGAERDKAIQVANATRDQSIGTREANRDQAVRLAELEKDQLIGEKTASFQRESQVKDAEREMRVRVADADATAIEGENAAKAVIAASEAALAVKRAEAFQMGEGKKLEAEAAVLEIQNRAMAKAALAEAERVEAEQRAKLEAPPKHRNPKSSSMPKPKPNAFASMPGPRPMPSSPNSTPKLVVTSRSWPRRAKDSSKSSRPAAAPKRPSKCSCSNTSTT